MSALKKLSKLDDQHLEIELTSHKPTAKPTVFSGSDQIKFFFDNRSEIESLLDCEFKTPTKIEAKAKPEAFGMVRWGNTTVCVYPKILCTDNRPNFDLMTALFFVVDGHQPEVFRDLATNQHRDSFTNFFDFYFYNVLSQIRKFVRMYTRVDFLSETQEVPGVKGRIKIEETVRRFGGLMHKSVCEVGIVERNNLLFGLIKTLTKKIINLSSHQLIQTVGSTVLSELSSFKEVEVTNANLEKLSSTSARIKRESKKTKALYKSLLQTLLFVTDHSKVFSSVAFSFNMDKQYEFLVREFLEKFSSDSVTVRSGNDCAEPLLHCNTSTVVVENEFENSISSGVVKIKPDLIFTQDNVVTCVADTKYKILTLKDSKTGIKVNGVKSADVQQILTYWIHNTEKYGVPPSVRLVYPMPDHASTQGTLLKCLGYIQLTLDGLEMKKHKKVLVEIVGVSVPILLNLITEPETNSKQLRSAAEQLGTTKQFGVS